MTLAQVQEMVVAGRGEGRYLVAAMASRINSDTLFYRAHNPGAAGRCRKKVQEEAGQEGTFSCRCGSKAIPASCTVLRYMVRLCLNDCSGHEWAIMFEADSLFGMTAQELQEERDRSEEEFLARVQDLQFQEKLWVVGGKLETYQGESRVKLTVEEVREVGWEREHPARLWEAVERMERELGVDHQEEWGVHLATVLQRIGK